MGCACAYFSCNQLPLCTCGLHPTQLFCGNWLCIQKRNLVKGSNYLETLADTKYVVFDKTGTLTKGVFEVNGIHPAAGFSGEELLHYCAYAESASSHPISLSLKKPMATKLTLTGSMGLKRLPGMGFKQSSMDIAYMPEMKS